MNNIIKSEFTILGTKGSGKTSYLLGLYKELSAGIKGFSFSIDANNDLKLREALEKLNNNTLGTERFPLLTTSLDTYLFTISNDSNPIMNFSWIDYPGKILLQFR